MEKRKHILLVEDDESILFGLQDILEDNGYQISTASNGTEGLKLATDKEIDLLVLDIMLPGMSGIDICKKIKKIKFKLPIIMLTAKNSELDKVSGLDYGADDYITKDRKSTRLNSSHVVISYAVFCLKKKNKTKLANETI